MNKNKDMVKYHNDLNRLNMATLKEKELELFYAICLKLKEKGIEEITIDISDFKKEFNISNKIDKARFREYIKSVHKKFSELKYTIETEKEIETIIFFKKFKTDLEANKMIITVNKEYSYILNNIVSYYTQFNFKEYQSLKSKYSKILMPRLAQWNSVKKIEFLKEDLFEILGVPKSCREKTSNFNNKVLTPIKAELPKVFYNLKVNPIKKSTAKNEIKSYLFSWIDRPKKEIKEVEAEEVKTLEISKNLKNLLDEATKNPKLEILEKPSIIEYLLKHYTENLIMLGIKQLLNSNITTKIKTRKYIVTLLEQLKIKENIRIITKEDKKIVENKKENEYIEKGKTNITQEEWDIKFEKELEKALEDLKVSNINPNMEILKITIKAKLNSMYNIKK